MAKRLAKDMNEDNKGKAVASAFQIGLSAVCVFCFSFAPQAQLYTYIHFKQPIQHICPAFCNNPDEPPQREYPISLLTIGTSAVVSTASVYGGALTKVI